MQTESILKFCAFKAAEQLCQTLAKPKLGSSKPDYKFTVGFVQDFIY